MSAEAPATATRPSLPEAQGAFTAARPAYVRTSAIDALRAREFARLDALRQDYLGLHRFLNLVASEPDIGACRS